MNLAQSRAKPEEGLLPYDSISRVMVMEGISLADDGRKLFDAYDRRRPLQLHVTCFYLWDQERRM